MTKDPVCKMDIDERQTNFNSEYLRTGFQVALVSAEHLTYREFLGGIPEVTLASPQRERLRRSRNRCWRR